MAIQFEQKPNLLNTLERVKSIGDLGAFTPPMKLPPPPKPKFNNPAYNLNIPGANYGGSSGGGGGNIDILMRAIAGKESGGRYSAVNPDSGAMGKYQIMPSNIQGAGRGWDYEALGRDVSTQQFMGSPQLQEAIARYKLNQYLSKYGMAGAAATWYGGDWGRKNMYSKKPQGKYPSMYDYVMAILRAAGMR